MNPYSSTDVEYAVVYIDDDIWWLLHIFPSSSPFSRLRTWKNKTEADFLFRCYYSYIILTIPYTAWFPTVAYVGYWWANRCQVWATAATAALGPRLLYKNSLCRLLMSQQLSSMGNSCHSCNWAPDHLIKIAYVSYWWDNSCQVWATAATAALSPRPLYKNCLCRLLMSQQLSRMGGGCHSCTIHNKMCAGYGWVNSCQVWATAATGALGPRPFDKKLLM